MDEPIPELGGDELGRLGRSVERMRSSLRDLIAYVARANEVLEQRVQERTAELALLNEQLRERDAQRQRLLRTVITAQEDERKRIARELHDETTQSLAVLTMGIETAAAAHQERRPDAAARRGEGARRPHARRGAPAHPRPPSVRPRRPGPLLGAPLVRRALPRAPAASRCAARSASSTGGSRRSSRSRSSAIGQEAMNNIARHAKAESVLIQLGLEGKDLLIEIEDDGQGFDPAVSPQDRPHYGLLGMRERAELLGGTALIESAPGKGTRLEIRVPLPDEPAPSTGAAAGLQSVVS